MLLIRLSRIHNLRGLLFTNSKINKCILNPSVNLHVRSVLRNPNLSSQVSKTELLNAKKNLEKDRLLFYYENPRFYHFLNGFGFVQFFFWIHLAEFTYNTLKKVNIDEEVNLARPFWWQKLSFKDESTRTLVASFCFFMGYVVLAICWIYTLRSVRMLVLRKGGKNVSIVTYAPLGRTRTTEVPLEKLTTDQTRQTAKNQLPFKVQGKWFFYLLDTKSGTFPNPELFDHTAGMKRTFTK